MSLRDKKNSIAILFFLTEGLISYGQNNFILNGGFEEPKEVSLSISAWDSNGGQPYYLADGWKSVLGSCDYYCDSVEFFSVMENPNFYDPQVMYHMYPDITNCYLPPSYENNIDLPHKGNNFAGICITSRKNYYTYEYYHETVRGEFNQPLQSNRDYKLSFWYKFNLTDNTHSINHVNIVLTNEEILGPTSNIFGCQWDIGNNEASTFFTHLNSHAKYRFQLQPQVAFNNWAYTEIYFVADGGERYFYVNVPDSEVENCNEYDGQYETSPAYQELDSCLCLNRSYIYLDEFSCVEAPTFPNIVTLDKDTLNSSFHSTDVTWPCDIEIYNRWGVHVGDITPQLPYYTPNESGIYFYAGLCGNAKKHGYFEVIE